MTSCSIARQHHQVDLVAVDQGEKPGLGLLLGFRSDRHVHEGHASRSRHRPEVRVVGDEEGDVDAQATDLSAVEQVIEAVAKL